MKSTQTQLNTIVNDPQAIHLHIEKQHNINITNENVVDYLNEITSYLVQLSDQLVKLGSTEEAEQKLGINALTEPQKDKFYASLKLKTALALAANLQNHLNVGDVIVNSLVVRVSGLK